MYLRYLAPVKTALGKRWKVAGQWGGGGCPRAHGYHYCPGFYVNTGLGRQGLIE